MSDNIKVVVKVRPLIPRESDEKLQWRVKNNALYQLDQNGKECGSAYTFDKVYDESTNTLDIYNDIAKPIVEAAVSGINGTIFAYGQTSSGKTYTMSGTEQSPGIIPLAVLDLFRIISNIPNREFLIRVSYIEIYNEKIIDLLDVKRDNIKIQNTTNGLQVDITETMITTKEEVLKIMEEGKAKRQIGSTNMNEESSRSHSIFQITIESREQADDSSESGCVHVSQLNLVDLAGSERVKQSGATGMRLIEGTHINKSLSTLTLVIKQLSEDATQHINYRDSKLTRILQNSLGGNANTSIICAVTPASVEETLSTLNFANRAKSIKNKPQVNEVTTDATMIQKLAKEIHLLKNQLENKKHLEKDNVTLVTKMQKLQRLILSGFKERSNKKLSSTMKTSAPRRVTISAFDTLPMEIEPLAKPLPSFYTPGLKYNPNTLYIPQTIPNSDFVPIENCRQLESVPEEVIKGKVTPTNTKKSTTFSDEVIDLGSESDDYDNGDTQCSPYHKCKEKSKTPPCVLRKSVKQAEKSFKDLIELTKREKMYPPNVVELLEKTEKDAVTITALRDENSKLNLKCIEKDSLIQDLKESLTKSEEELKAINCIKTDLEKKCQKLNSNLIEGEVSLESLKNRFKSREEELLSLIGDKETQSATKTLTLDKEVSILLDISKDISLVYSDTENETSHDENTQAQLSKKDQEILELQANLHLQKEKLNITENTLKELQNDIYTCNKKLTLMESENNILKLNIESLNQTIYDLNNNLNSADNEIKSYIKKNTDLELKLKSNVNPSALNDILETMSLNEDTLIENNKNIENFIEQIKVIVKENCNKSNDLKCQEQSQEVTLKQISFEEQIQSKDNKIDSLLKEIEMYKNALSENSKNVENVLLKEQEVKDELSAFKAEHNQIKDGQVLNIKLARKVLEKSRRVVCSDTATDYDDETDNLTYILEELSENLHLIENLTSTLKTCKVNLEHDVENLKEEIKKKSESCERDLSSLKECIEKHKEIEKDLHLKIEEITIENGILHQEQINIEHLTNVSKQKDEILSYISHKFKEVIPEINLNLINIDSNSSKQSIDDLFNKLLLIKQEHCKLNEYAIGVTKEIEELRSVNSILKTEFNDMRVSNSNYVRQLESLESELKQISLNFNISNTTINVLRQDLTNKLEIIEILRNDLQTNTILLKKSDEKIKEQELMNIHLKLKLSNSDLKFKSMRITGNDTKPESSSFSFGLIKEASSQSFDEKYKEILEELNNVSEENLNLNKDILDLKAINHSLVMEQQEARNEIHLLVECALDLERKIARHKTWFHTLIATSYAECKLLKSQVKVFRHHHNRCHNICSREFPDFKKQLNELMAILKLSEFTFSKENVNSRLFSLPDTFDKDLSVSIVENESTVADLMLDNNFTLTSADNTLQIQNHNQTCFEISQLQLESEIESKLDPNILLNENKEMIKEIECLKNEKSNLLQQITEYKDHCCLTKVDASVSVTKLIEINHDDKECQVDLLNQELLEMKKKELYIEEKYNMLQLQITSLKQVQKKLNDLEEEHHNKVLELNDKKKEFKLLQQENDTLSNQVIEYIDEVEIIKKELQIEKAKSMDLDTKFNELSSKSKVTICSICLQELNQSAEPKTISKSLTKLYRRYSESDTSSRQNKICTLQKELHASREDCKRITEEVATIKNHLDRSNTSLFQNIEVDENINSPNVGSVSENYETVSAQPNKLQHITEEKCSDLYSCEKAECLKFFIEKTESEKENLNSDVKIIELMNKLYTCIMTKHNNEVENLVNQLRDFQDENSQLQNSLTDLNAKCSLLTKDLNEKELNSSKIVDVMIVIRSNINFINQFLKLQNKDDVKVTEIENLLKDKFFGIVDSEFGTSSTTIFEFILNKLKSTEQENICLITDINALNNKTNDLNLELETVNKNLNQLKCDLLEKEKAYNLIKVQKEKLFEISNAVTIDIIQKETILSNIKDLLKNKILIPKDETSLLDLPVDALVKSLVERFVDNYQNRLTLEQEEHLKNEISNINKKTHKREEELNATILNLRTNVEELKSMSIERESMVKDLKAELSLLKQHKCNNEEVIKLIQKIEVLENKNLVLKSANDMITNEKELYTLELEKAGNIIKLNKEQINKMTADILVLSESVKDLKSTIDTVKSEAKLSLEENTKLKDLLNQSKSDCSRLKLNIKTHEKSAEIQSQRITRLEQQKKESDKNLSLKEEQYEKVNKLYTELVKKYNEMEERFDKSKVEHNNLEMTIKTLEGRIAELETEVEQKARSSLGLIANNSRRRRQSLLDSKLMFDNDIDNEDHEKMEALFSSRSKQDDMFMDVDHEPLDRSPHSRLSRRRDSIRSRNDDEDDINSKGEKIRENVMESRRRRRQSVHDLHRTVLRNTPSPHDLLSIQGGDKRDTPSAYSSANNSIDNSEVNQLRDKLRLCQQELEELRERYKELDDECETCSEYLRERDEQCIRLKKEKTALEKSIQELKGKMVLQQTQKDHAHSVRDAAVNTDEDWANLHAVVVDRMSFDAEVEKNKKLTKAIEEFRMKNRDLKATIAKLQMNLGKLTHDTNPYAKELDEVKKELKSYKVELEDLKVRCKELDEECETCSQYLRERDEQCRKLKEAKALLESRLHEYEGDSPAGRVARRKRQSLHDLNRTPTPVERSDHCSCSQPNDEEIHRLKQALEKLERQLLENMSQSQPAPMYVATGSAIVQNQQMTDILKENQKLKKMNAKLIHICKKRGKNTEDATENDI